MQHPPHLLGLNKLNPSATVLKIEDPGIYRRGEEVLFIEKETASWIILSGASLAFFNGLRGPAAVRDLLNSMPDGLSRQQKEELLFKLYRRNMITLDGASYHDPGALWDLPQKYPTFLCFHLTSACNMQCDYCYARAGTPEQDTSVMPREVAHRVVEKILEDLPDKHLLIDFHGGEPFLRFDDMVETIEYAREYNKKRGTNKDLKFTIQTNGLLLTLERAKLLKSLDGMLGVSIDGPAEIHDRHRVRADRGGTFDTVWKNLMAVREAKIHAGPLAVVHHPEEYPEVFKFFINNGFNSFRINYSAYIGRAMEELEFPFGRGETFAKHYLAMVDLAFDHVKETGKRLNLQDLNNYLNNVMSRIRPFMCHRSPCGCGNSILGFGRDGGIFACEEATDVPEFKIGSVFDSKPLTEILDTSETLREIKNRTVDNIPRCSRCYVKRFCGGRCTTKSFARYGSFRREDPICRFYQVLYPELIWRVHDRPEEAKLLNSYIRPATAVPDSPQ